MPRFSIASFAALSLLFFSATFAGAVDLEKLREVDTDKDLTLSVGYDRLSKFLIATSNTSDPNIRINRSLIEEAIAELIHEGKAYQLIADDLRRGDALLYDELVKLFASFNFPINQARKMVEVWPHEGVTETGRATLQNASRRPSALGILRIYSMQTPSRWTHVLEGSRKIMDGESRISFNLLADTLIRARAVPELEAKKYMELVRKQNLPARMELCRGIGKIMEENGALVRYMERAKVTPQNSWALAVWDKVIEKIIDDPLLRREYVERLTTVAPLYDEVSALFLDALKDYGHPFVKGYYAGSIIKGSRFDWVKNNLKSTRNELRDSNTSSGHNAAERRVIIDALVDKCRQSSKYADWLLWHLTRYGEAIVLPLRHGIAAGLANNEKAARKISSNMIPFNDVFAEILWDSDAFGYYQGGEKEFRKRMEDGTVDRNAILQYGAAAGRVLAQNDQAWAAAVKASRMKRKSRDMMTECISAAIQGDPNTLLAWLQTMRKNDPNLKGAFHKFLFKRNETKDEYTTDQWLESVAGHIRGGHLVGNPEVARFRTLFIEFMNTNSGYDAIWLRLALESIYVPYALREAMGEVLFRYPDRFWRIYGMLTSANGPSIATLVPSIERYSKVSRLPGALLEEISARNVGAADAVDPVWEQVFSEKSPVPPKIVKTVAAGSTLSDVYRLYSLALIGAMNDPSVWKRVREAAYGHMNMNAEAPDIEVKKALYQQLQQRGSEALPFIRVVAEDAEVNEVVRRRMRDAVKYTGQAHLAADFIMRDVELSRFWSDAISKAVAREPGIMRAVLDSLTARRVGDYKWEEEMKKLRKELIALVTGDRVLFEQLIDGKNAEFKKAFLTLLEQKTGMVPERQ